MHEFISIVVPLLVTVAGAFVYMAAKDGKILKMSEITFFCGLFWLVYVCAERVVHWP